MPQFRYVAKNPEGKVVDGVITCNDRAAAIRQVESQRFIPIKIEPLSTSATSESTGKTESSPAATMNAW